MEKQNKQSKSHNRDEVSVVNINDVLEHISCVGCGKEIDTARKRTTTSIK